MMTTTATRQVLTFFACGLVVVTLSGCWAAQERITLSHVDKFLPTLEKGATLQQVEHAFDSKAEHEFTIERDGKCLVCVRVEVGGYDSPCYVVLSDGKLEKIVEPPSRRTEEVRIDGKKVGRTLPWLPEEEAERVISAKDLCGPTLVESVRKRFHYMRNSNLAGGEYILGPIMAFGYLLQLPESLRQQKLVEQFNPLKLRMGMTPEEVETVFRQAPCSQHQNGNESVHVFGCDRWVPPVAVVFLERSVNRIFSNRFFNKDVYLPANIRPERQHVAMIAPSPSLPLSLSYPIRGIRLDEQWSHAFRYGIIRNPIGGDLGSTGLDEVEVACPGSQAAWLNTWEKT